jgi:hypothetical protein
MTKREQTNKMVLRHAAEMALRGRKQTVDFIIDYMVTTGFSRDRPVRELLEELTKAKTGEDLLAEVNQRLDARERM